MNSVMQRDNERGRIAVDGRCTDAGERCTLVVVSEVGRTWAFYPHGWGKFGVRLTDQEARRVAQMILERCPVKLDAGEHFEWLTMRRVNTGG